MMIACSDDSISFQTIVGDEVCRFGPSRSTHHLIIFPGIFAVIALFSAVRIFRLFPTKLARPTEVYKTVLIS